MKFPVPLPPSNPIAQRLKRDKLKTQFELIKAKHVYTYLLMTKKRGDRNFTWFIEKPNFMYAQPRRLFICRLMDEKGVIVAECGWTNTRFSQSNNESYPHLRTYVNAKEFDWEVYSEILYCMYLQETSYGLLALFLAMHNTRNHKILFENEHSGWEKSMGFHLVEVEWGEASPEPQSSPVLYMGTLDEDVKKKKSK